MPTKAKNGKSKFMAARFPLELEALIMAEAEALGVPYSQVLIAAVRAYFAGKEARE